MAVPKRRISKTRQRKRRTHKKASMPMVVKCEKCLQPKMPHRVCPHCGHYKGREVVRPPEA